MKQLKTYEEFINESKRVNEKRGFTIKEIHKKSIETLKSFGIKSPSTDEIKDMVITLKNFITGHDLGLVMESEEIDEAQVISKELGGFDDKEFLKIVWNMDISDLETLMDKSKSDLKWLKANSKGLLGTFNRKEAQWVKSRISFIDEIIKSKNKDSSYIPDNYK